MKRILILTFIVTFAICSSAIAQNCPGGICPTRSYTVYRSAPRYTVRYYSAPVYSAPPVVYYAAPRRYSYSRTRSAPSWSFGWGMIRSNGGRQCVNGICR